MVCSFTTVFASNMAICDSLVVAAAGGVCPAAAAAAVPIDWALRLVAVAVLGGVVALVSQASCLKGRILCTATVGDNLAEHIKNSGGDNGLGHLLRIA